MRFPAAWSALLVVSLVSCGPGTGVTPLHDLKLPVLDDRLQADREALLRYHEALQEIQLFMNENPDLFPAARLDKQRVVPYGQRIRIVNIWQRSLDYFLALESIRQYHDTFWRIDDKKGRTASFFVMYAAFITQYRFALTIIAKIENDPGLDLVLNEPAPELGLTAGTYSQFKLHYLNVAIASRFAWFEALRKNYGRPDQASLAEFVKEDSEFVWGMGKGQGVQLTFANAFDMVKKGGKAAWLPLQAGVSEWMGDTKVWRPGKSLITPEQISATSKQLKPGDVLFERREWYLSNIGLPGFWPHTALYIGTPQERAAFFGNDPPTVAWVKEMGEPSGLLENLLKQRFPEHYTDSTLERQDHHVPRCLEAVSEGVIFTTLEHSAACDAMAVLRPRLEPKEKARAIFVAFSYAGRPYDFDFDMASDASLVCTELIYKAYEPTRDFRGLKFPLVTVAGRQITPANTMVKQHAKQRGTPFQQFDFVVFLDGLEKQRIALPADEDTLCESWKRPKWHVWTHARREEPN